MRTLLFTFAILILTAPMFVGAQYSPLVQVPGGTEGSGSFAGYINALYVWSIGIAGLLAVVKIIVAGAKYMTTDIVSTKGDAKKDIQSALLGLLLVAGAVLILTEINPNLLDLKFTDTIEKPEAIAPPTSSGLTTGGGTGEDGTDVGSTGEAKRGLEEFTPSEYRYILDEYTRVEGSVRVSRPSDYCKNEASSGANGTMQANLYRVCMSRAENSMNDYCLHNAGNFSSQNGVFRCQLPTIVRRVDDFSNEFEAYKNNLPENNPDEVAAAIRIREMDEPDMEVYEILCKAWGGVFKDTKLISRSDVNDRKCVKY